MVLVDALYSLLAAFIELTVVFIIIVTIVSYLRRLVNKSDEAVHVAFFHPYCLAAGGGERVLWAAVRSLQQRWCTPASSGKPRILSKITIYTGDAVDHCRNTFVDHCRKRFAIEIPDPSSIEFVRVRARLLLEASTWPRFTMFGQTLGSLIVGFEALCRSVPDIFIDSTGFAFTLPIFRLLAGCQTLAYVHYPTISTDMIERVASNQTQYNNDAGIARSVALSTTKLIYYRIFAILYGLAGRACDVTLVNSTWTYNHIKSIWSKPSRTQDNISIVYPPCDIDLFHQLTLKSDISASARVVREDDSDIITSTKTVNIISVAQFRPEKDHAMQIKAFALLLKRLKHEKSSRSTSRERSSAEQPYAASKSSNVRLTLLGSNRDGKDQPLIEHLKDFVNELGIDEQVSFAVNTPFDEMLQLMSKSKIALHTMRDEHFGISVVEAMAAGLITIAHNSGGPKLDIVKPAGTLKRGELDKSAEICGFLCSTPEEYAEVLHRVLHDTSEQELQWIRDNAWKHVQMFNQSEFEEKFADRLKILLPPLLRRRSSATAAGRRRISSTSSNGNESPKTPVSTGHLLQRQSSINRGDTSN